jgi:gamma-glutamyl:cysteine ligase YbdK (ATP-grasp superfamily)
MSRTEHLRLFSAYGIEMEYMIVDRQTLKVLPVSDFLLQEAARLPGAVVEEDGEEGDEGAAPGEVSLGDMGWSNELVMHVIEVKTNGPTRSLADLDAKFQREVVRINAVLAARGACLMPTAMHPFFDPDREMKLWVHGNAEIYSAYNRIFDCRGHGWSNLQSVHINLPFYDDAEFGKLHAAIRLALPILPGLAAASPIYGGKPSGRADSRLEFYRMNQKAVPSLTGGVIPEQAFTKAEYDEKIFQKIYRDIAPHDPDGILRDEWLNSRGAIARFQRNAIEIRVIDIQESPRMDAAIVAAVVALVRGLADGLWADDAAQRRWAPEPLRPIFQACLEGGDRAVIDDAAYLAVFGFPGKKATAGELWAHLGERLCGVKDYPLAQRRADFEHIMTKGCLARRILAATGASPKPERIAEVYRRLCGTLAEGGAFDAEAV